MEKIKTFIKKNDNLVIIMIFLVIFTRGFYAFVFNTDETLNFSTIFQMCNGYEIYKDLNIIITPLFFYIIKIIFNIFTCNYFVFRICNIVINCIFYLVLYNIFKQVLKSKTSSLLYTLTIFLCCSSTLGGMCNYNTLALMFSIIGILINIDEKRSKNFILQGIILFLVFMTKQNIGIYYGLGLILNNIINKECNEREKYNLLKTFLIFVILFAIYCIYLVLNNNLYNFINYCFLGLTEFNRNLKFDYYLIMLVGISLMEILLTIISRKKINKKIITIECFAIPLLLIVYPIFNSYHIELALIGILSVLIMILDSIFLSEIINIKLKKIVVYCILTYMFINSIFYFCLWCKNISQIQYIKKEFYGSILDDDNNNNLRNVTEYIKNNDKKTIILSPYAKIYTIILNYNNGIFDLPFLGNLGKEGEEGLIKKISELENVSILIEKNEKDLVYQESIKAREYVKSNFKMKGEIEQFSIYEK